jgi:imidazolonepropionase-like amidohydrolase
MTVLLPYADAEAGASSGHSGSDTSAERAHRDDADGTTAARQLQTIRLLDAAGQHGLTWHELARAADWHHGQASGVLSVLHKAGRVERLTERRRRCLVYVLPTHVADRETAPHGGHQWRARAIAAEATLAAVRAAFDTDPTNVPHIRRILNPTQGEQS